MKQNKINSFSNDTTAIEIITEIYSLPAVISIKDMICGYDDSNLKLHTKNGDFLLKVFSHGKSKSQCESYVSVVKLAISSGINHPPILLSTRGELPIIDFRNQKYYVSLMQFINSKNIFESKITLKKDQLKQIVKQAAKLNQITDFHITYYDQWAIVNLPREFERKRKILMHEEKILISKLVKRFSDVEVSSLPHSLIHGDIIKTNILLNNSEPIIIDFSAAGYYPRIQEIAVLASNIFFDENNPSKYKSNISMLISEYQKVTKLTERELALLPLFIAAAHVVNIVSASYEKYCNNNTSTENEYWLSLGRKGLETTTKQFKI